MSHFERASAALAAGDHAQALSEINLHLAAPAALDAASAWIIGECLAALGQGRQALDYLSAALEDPAFQTPARFLLAGRTAADQGQQELAFLFGLKGKRQALDDPDINRLLLDLAKASGSNDLLDHIIPSLLKAARPDDLNQIIGMVGPDRNNPHSLDLFKRLADLYPERSDYLVMAFLLAREHCDFDYIEAFRKRYPLQQWASRSDLVGLETPLDNLYWCGDEAVNRLARSFPSGPPPKPDPQKRRHLPLKPKGAKLHIGYLSADFIPAHATMFLLGDVLRWHDRQDFDISLFCHTSPDAYLQNARPHYWGRIVDINRMSDAEAAAAIRAAGVDILVDLKGHTAYSRSAILNHGAAPIQATWLGFPGSVTEIDLDYVISDRFVTPDSAAPHYHENFCRLPHSYQPNDPTRPRPPAPPRSALGLPDDAFVMACFNARRKISPETFELWVDVLRASPNAVLWLLEGSRRLESNVRRRLQERGIDRGRVYLAPSLDQDRHLARLKAADIALDTFPYNGHTTTSDALWAGIPVVALKGTNFASRVSESLLNAIGMPELVAEDPAGYVQLATELASNSEKTAALRQRLENNRLTTPLYDSQRFARDLERGYRMMQDRALAGLPAQSFDVPETDMSRPAV